MRHKRLQPSIILTLVAIAFFIKGFKDQDIVLFMIGGFIFVLAFMRGLLVIKFMDETSEDVHYADFIEQYLQKDSCLIEMLSIYKSGLAEVLYAESDGVLLLDPTNHTYHATVKSSAAVKDMLVLIVQDYESLVVYDDIFDEVMGKDLKYRTCRKYYNYVYRKQDMVVVENQDVDYRDLDECYIDTIKEYYFIDSLMNEYYIKKCVKMGMIGAFIEDTLIGFIGLHPSGAIGLLKVWEGYEGQHIGSSLQAMMMNKCLQEGKLVYTQVEVENEVSIHIQTKLHMEKASSVCKWYLEK